MDQRGSALVLVVLLLVPLLGMLALAVDLGLLMTARTEAQRTADAAVLAGAQSLIDAPLDEDRARAWAREYAALNDVRGSMITLRDQDIDVLLDEGKVRARVFRTEEWGGPVATIFARVLGIHAAGVSAMAAAQVHADLPGKCMLPLALPDRWCEEQPLAPDGSCPLGAWPDPELPDRFGDDEEDWYAPWDPDTGGPSYTGYGEDDAGYPTLIKSGNPQQAPHPGWFYPFRIPGLQGGADYREAIRECRAQGVEWGEDMEVDTEPGNMIGPTRQGFRDLIAKDPGAKWDEECDCVTGSAFAQSPRIRPMVMFDPGAPPDPGKKSFQVTAYVGVFVEEVRGNEIWVRFFKYIGPNPANPSSDAVTVRLVE